MRAVVSRSRSRTYEADSKADLMVAMVSRSRTEDGYDSNFFGGETKSEPHMGFYCLSASCCLIYCKGFGDFGSRLTEHVPDYGNSNTHPLYKETRIHD